MIAELETQIIAALQTLFDRFGWFGVAGLMAFENATGITPSEIILGLAGWLLLAAKDAPFVMVFVGALVCRVGQHGRRLSHLLAGATRRPARG